MPKRKRADKSVVSTTTASTFIDDCLATDDDHDIDGATRSGPPDLTADLNGTQGDSGEAIEGTHAYKYALYLCFSLTHGI
jgi:hypothetical protein